jgi:putative iron-regulated protein
MKRLLLGCTLALLCFGCRDNNDEEEILQLKKDVLKHYASTVLFAYDESLTEAQLLKTAIDQFVQAPDNTKFQACKNAWLDARLPYGVTEAFRFYGGPIDDEDGPEGLINAWPMDESFIDYVQGNPLAGLINQPLNYPQINAMVLEELNETISETSIFTGYHAIEFLLWGQDLSTTGPGERSYTDYVTGGTAPHPERRGQYLSTVANLLVDHLTSVRDEWTSDATYRKTITEATDVDVVLGYLFTSLGSLSKGELAGERMFVAIDTKDQENEHSCFSDNTINDIKMNFEGLKTVYYGTYYNNPNISGANLHQLAEKMAPEKAEKAKAAFDAAEQAINALPAPFDQAIVNQSNQILPAITALRTLSDRLSDVGLAVGAKF